MKKHKQACLGLLLIAGFGAALSSPVRSEDKVLGLFDDWGAQTFLEKGKTGCSIWSQPNKEGGKVKKRGAVYVYVTHRPWEKRIDEVSLVAGYSYKKDSTVHARIGGQKFTLFTDGDTAWNRSPKEDKSLVAAMRRGNSMVVTGVPKKGKQTTDTYSLKGFSKAYEAIGKACGLTS